jgi:hypothetical protein
MIEEWAIAHILGVMLDKIEGVEDCDSSALATRQFLEPRQAVRPEHIVKLLALIRSAAPAIVASRTGPVIRVAAIKPYRGTITADDHPVTVTFDFVNPISTGRGLAAITGWAGIIKPGGRCLMLMTSLLGRGLQQGRRRFAV